MVFKCQDKKHKILPLLILVTSTLVLGLNKIQELTDINSSFVNDIDAKLTDLSERFNKVTSKYDKVYSELQQCKSFNSHLLARIIQLERNAVTNSQYSRRETIKLNPAPTEIHEDFWRKVFVKRCH